MTDPTRSAGSAFVFSRFVVGAAGGRLLRCLTVVALFSTGCGADAGQATGGPQAAAVGQNDPRREVGIFFKITARDVAADVPKGVLEAVRSAVADGGYRVVWGESDADVVGTIDVTVVPQPAAPRGRVGPASSASRVSATFSLGPGGSLARVSGGYLSTDPGGASGFGARVADGLGRSGAFASYSAQRVRDKKDKFQNADAQRKADEERTASNPVVPAPAASVTPSAAAAPAGSGQSPEQRRIIALTPEGRRPPESDYFAAVGESLTSGGYAVAGPGQPADITMKVSVTHRNLVTMSMGYSTEFTFTLSVPCEGDDRRWRTMWESTTTNVNRRVVAELVAKMVSSGELRKCVDARSERRPAHDAPTKGDTSPY